MQEFYETLSAQKDTNNNQISWLNSVRKSSHEQIEVLVESLLEWVVWD